jgi:hypothetical protein
VNAELLLGEVAREMRAVSLEAVLIGNAAAALQGAPVTTIDFDFLFRKTPRNMAKMKALARALRATIFRPYYPASDFYRLMREGLTEGHLHPGASPHGLAHTCSRGAKEAPAKRKARRSRTRG